LLTAQITGGLGNQLFTYARLATYAYRNGINLQIDGSISERVLGRAPDLFDFKLLGEPRILLNSYTSAAVQRERFLWRSSFTRSISKRHRENVLGNSEISKKNLDGWKVRGFFQDYRVAEDFIDIFGESAISLQKESRELSRTSDEISQKSVAAIHVRRGDYLNYQDSFGLLSDDYYVNALKTLSEKKNLSEAIVFTDSPEMVEDLRNKLDMKSRIISPSDLSTSETMVLMSRCSGLVTSNSTFSFWAGILGNDLEVVVPDPWFKSTDAWLRSADFSKPEWLQQKANWS
jgi:hypothetical protein